MKKVIIASVAALLIPEIANCSLKKVIGRDSSQFSRRILCVDGVASQAQSGIIARNNNREWFASPMSTVGGPYSGRRGRLSIIVFEPGSQLTRINCRVFSYCTSLTSINIPSGVKTLGEECFGACNALSDVTFALDSQLTSIESGAFSYCILLTSINIPSGVKTLGKNVFSDCERLESVYFGPDSRLTSIGSGAFASCISLISMDIPRSVVVLERECFFVVDD
ncbi:MAG: leucine-rich repeat domain-containing protein [Holosporales bacterium]|nr:leucine-rich repeat domain-containing protein [Holosporales bacterium]